VVICLERADLHIAQMRPLPLTVSCFSIIQTVFTFLVSAHLGSPGQMAIKWVCVCVCVCHYFGLIVGTIRKYVLAFSVRVNGSRILSVDRPATDGSTLPALHGIRFLSMSWVILGHTYVIGLYMTSKLTSLSVALIT